MAAALQKAGGADAPDHMEGRALSRPQGHDGAWPSTRRASLHNAYTRDAARRVGVVGSGSIADSSTAISSGVRS